jgi:DNA-binding SARP family transcriptional activator
MTKVQKSASAWPQVRVSLLGGFAVEISGRSVDLPLGAQRLVAFIALRGRPVLRGEAAGSLWPDHPEERAAANLRCVLWRLRGAADGVLRVGRRELALSSHVRVDVAALSEAERLGEPLKDPNRTGLLLAGDLLPGWYEDWVSSERERLRIVRLQALERLANELCLSGQLQAAETVCLAAVALDPVRESAQRSLIRILLAEGNPGEAIRRYRSYRKHLRNELGVAPSREMEVLVDSIAAD